MKDTNLNIRINSELLEQAKKQAEIENRTLSNYIITLIKKDLKKEEMEMEKLIKKGNGKVEVSESKGYVLVEAIVRSKPFKERVYNINGFDCINIGGRFTSSGVRDDYYKLSDILKDENGVYTKPIKAPWFMAVGRERSLFEKQGYSVRNDETEYKEG